MSIDHRVARYMADIAAAIEAVPPCNTTYGEFYVSEVQIGFNGDDTNLRVVPNEHGGYDIAEDAR